METSGGRETGTSAVCYHARVIAPSRTILVTGGAGFIGSSLSLDFKRRSPADRVIALDNLRRRGVELNVARLRAAGVEFRHGDVRAESDLRFDEPIDLLIECSAEPSVMAGRDGHVRYAIDSNLAGCVNCLELARRAGAAFVFLSTSRIYPIAALSALRYETRGARFALLHEQPVPGVSAAGIAEGFPLDGARTLYGATKLAAELVIAEYVDMFGLQAVINRCGVVSGPWQMGYAEQGVFAHWMFAHYFKRPLAYIGYGGLGHQVRDVMHVADLADLIDVQIRDRSRLKGEVYNVGGGLEVSASLAEFTELCASLTGNRLALERRDATRAGDVPIYISDTTRVRDRFGWTPKRSVSDIASDLYRWIDANAEALRGSLGA
jgi:CDP-paratose 2-epimerase